QLVSDLAARTLDDGSADTIAVAHSARDEIAQMSLDARPGRQRKVRKAIAEILEREPQAQRQLAAGAGRIGQVAKCLGHRATVAGPALGVDEQSPSRVIEIGLLGDAREDVGDGAATRPGIERLARSQQWSTRGAREGHEPLQVAFLLPVE